MTTTALITQDTVIITITHKIGGSDFPFDLKTLADHLRAEAKRAGRKVEIKIGRECDEPNAWLDLLDGSIDSDYKKARTERLALEWAAEVAWTWVSARIVEASAALGTQHGADAAGRILDLDFEARESWNHASAELRVSPYKDDAYRAYLAAYKAACKAR